MLNGIRYQMHKCINENGLPTNNYLNCKAMTPYVVLMYYFALLCITLSSKFALSLLGTSTPYRIKTRKFFGNHLNTQ